MTDYTSELACPQYKDSACCSDFSNEYLKDNFMVYKN